MEILIERESISSVFICARKQSGAAPVMFSSNTRALMENGSQHNEQALLDRRCYGVSQECEDNKCEKSH